MATDSKQKLIVGIACDHAGFELKTDLLSKLEQAGYELEDFGCYDSDSVDYGDYADKLALALNEDDKFGILICGSGVGMSIAANRHKHIRAALCEDVAMAELSRLHNDANIVVLGARRLDFVTGFAIVSKFLTTDFSGDERHIRRIGKISV